MNQNGEAGVTDPDVEEGRNAYLDKERRASGCGVIVGIVVFVASWIYCMNEYGFLFGFGLGWLPSGILAAMIGGIVYAVNKP